MIIKRIDNTTVEITIPETKIRETREELEKEIAILEERIADLDVRFLKPIRDQIKPRQEKLDLMKE